MICQPQVLVIVLFAVSNQVCFEIPVELETEAVTMMLPELQTLWVEVPRVT